MIRLYDVTVPWSWPIHEEMGTYYRDGAIWLPVCARSKKRAKAVTLRTWRRWRRGDGARKKLPFCDCPDDFLGDADYGFNPFVDMEVEAREYLRCPDCNSSKEIDLVFDENSHEYLEMCMRCETVIP